MKNLLIFVFASIVSTFGFAQSETLFANLEVSGFGGPIFSVSQLNNQSTVFAGGGGGVIIGDFFIGGFGEGGNLTNTTISNESYDLDLGYGGLWLGYSFFNQKAIHPFLGIKLASGEMNLTASISDQTIESTNIQVLSPEVGIEFNFTPWMRLVTHLGYREVAGLGNNNLLRKEQLTSLTGGLTLRFGFFR